MKLVVLLSLICAFSFAAVKYPGTVNLKDIDCLNNIIQTWPEGGYEGLTLNFVKGRKWIYENKNSVKNFNDIVVGMKTIEPDETAAKVMAARMVASGGFGQFVNEAFTIAKVHSIPIAASLCTSTYSRKFCTAPDSEKLAVILNAKKYHKYMLNALDVICSELNGVSDTEKKRALVEINRYYSAKLLDPKTKDIAEKIVAKCRTILATF